MSLALAGGLGAAILLYLGLFHAPVTRRLGRVLGRWTDTVGVPERVRGPASRAWGELERAADMAGSTRVVAFGLTLCAHAAGVLSWLFLARALGLDASALTLGWMRSAVVVLTMVPVSLGGLGIREAALVFLLGPYGVAPERAIALSFLILLAAAVYAAVGGALQAIQAAAERPRA